jgi:hypothetical protein
MESPHPHKKSNPTPWIIGIIVVIALIFLLTRFYETDGSADGNTRNIPETSEVTPAVYAQSGGLCFNQS